MRTRTIAWGALGVALVLLAVVAGYRIFVADVGGTPPRRPAMPTPTGSTPVATHAAGDDLRGFLYGRVTTVAGVTYQGRLRWGRDQEAFWSDPFNGVRRESAWLHHVPRERQPRDRLPVELLGFQLSRRESNAGRLVMVRFGDVARLEANGRAVRLTLKGGAAVDLDRLEAGDFDDGVRVWDGSRGVVDLRSAEVRTIELLPTPPLGAAPYRLFGTVRTTEGDFTGFLAWDREESVGSDELHARAAEGEVALRYDTLRSIARVEGGSTATLLDGREIALADSGDAGDGNRGVYVDDPRYGRVLVSWSALQRVDFAAGGSGPGYGEFPPGRPLTGTVTTRAGRELTGRLVYDVDESESIETLDAPAHGLDYNIPFGLIASIELPRVGEPDQRARVTLHRGEVLRLERAGDLGEGNAGVLVFGAGRERPEHVPWNQLERIDLERPPAMYPPLDGG
jgi:hypothetical protein